MLVLVLVYYRFLRLRQVQKEYMPSRLQLWHIMHRYVILIVFCLMPNITICTVFQKLVAANNLQDSIKVIPGKIEEIELPEKVDVIISEPMGYMLYNERMLETYLHAKKWLVPGGKMYPSRGDLHVVPFTDDSLYMEQFGKANFW